MLLNRNDAHVIDIIKDINAELDNFLNRLDARKPDYLICLHKFMLAEKNFIVQSLNEKTGCDLVVIELY